MGQQGAHRKVLIVNLKKKLSMTSSYPSKKRKTKRSTRVGSFRLGLRSSQTVITLRTWESDMESLLKLLAMLF